MSWGLGILAALLLLTGAYGAVMYRRKHLGIWLGAYYARRRKLAALKPHPGRPVHVLFCLVDHFEPLSGPSREAERERMRLWLERYPRLADAHRDSDGRPPQHSWFYPGEVYDEEVLEELSQLAGAGYGEIELHYHHKYDTPERLTAKFATAVRQFGRHGALLTIEEPPRVAYGFIHGNMALNNSRDVTTCGVNSELIVLKETGCYADFSMPTAPCASQTRKINAVYYAADNPGKPKSHDDGVDVAVGRPPSGDLMIIPGPLALDWRNRKWGLFPKIENGELQVTSPPDLSRIRNWVAQHIHVTGRPDWVLVKVSCHGAEDRNREVLLGATADRMYADLEREYRDRPGYALHYVTARELYNIVKAAEAGERGNPDRFRDYAIPPYRTHASQASRQEKAG
jgi:hypothetical protein